jgi:hypothetical protein
VAEQDAARIPGACTRATLTATLLLSALTSSSIPMCLLFTAIAFPHTTTRVADPAHETLEGPWSLLNLGRPSLGDGTGAIDSLADRAF